MAFLVYYSAWDVSANAPKTGDAANHTVAVAVDGANVTGLTASEVADGLYSVSLTDGQLPAGSRFAPHGSSSTADVYLFGRGGVRPEAMRGTDNASTHTAAAVWSVGTRALTDKAGFSLSSAGIQAIWDKATSALATAGSIGKLLVDMLNAAVGSRLASSSYTAPENAKIDELHDNRLTTVRAGNLDNLDQTVSSRLAASGYTAPDNTGIGNIWGRLDVLTEDDGSGNQRYTTKALEQAPSGGGGGDATEANQTTIIAHLVAIKGSTFVEGTDALDALSAAIGNISVGDGQDWVSTEVLDEDSNPINGALVGVSANSDGSSAFWAYTNTSGIAKFRLVASNTYYKFVQASGYETVRWKSFTAVAD